MNTPKAQLTLPTLKLSRDAITNEPLYYNNGHEFKVVPVRRDSPLYVNIGGGSKEERLALAIALASAPALLGALQAMLGETPPFGQPGHVDLNEAVKMARAAIAATEEPNP